MDKVKDKNFYQLKKRWLLQCILGHVATTTETPVETQVLQHKNAYSLYQ